MSSRPLALSLAIATLSGAYALQQAGSPPLEPALEARVQKLGKQLRCATCQGLSIADSPASMARAQLDKVREMVSAGKSDERSDEIWRRVPSHAASNVTIAMRPNRFTRREAFGSSGAPERAADHFCVREVA